MDRLEAEQRARAAGLHAAIRANIPGLAAEVPSLKGYGEEARKREAWDKLGQLEKTCAGLSSMLDSLEEHLAGVSRPIGAQPLAEKTPQNICHSRIGEMIEDQIVRLDACSHRISSIIDRLEV